MEDGDLFGTVSGVVKQMDAGTLRYQEIDDHLLLVAEHYRAEVERQLRLRQEAADAARARGNGQGRPRR